MDDQTDIPAASTRPVVMTTARDGVRDVSASQQHVPVKGAIFITLAMICAVGIDVNANLLIDRYPVHQVILFRGVFSIIPVVILVMMTGGPKMVRIGAWSPHIQRALYSIGAMIFFFLSLRYMTLADATAIAMAAPLFITVLSIPMLGEVVGRHRWGAVAVGFIGVVVMLRPSPSGLADPVVLMPIGAALFYGLAQIVTRKYAHTESTQAYTAMSTVFVSVFAAAYCLTQDWVPLRLEDAPAMVGIGLCGGVMTIFMIIAYRSAEASFVSSMDYTALIWAVLFGWLIFDELPDPVTMIGAAVVVGAGLYIVRRETIRARELSVSQE